MVPRNSCIYALEVYQVCKCVQSYYQYYAYIQSFVLLLLWLLLLFRVVGYY